MSAEQASSIQSQALSANLKETAGTVHVDPRFAPLRDIVGRQPGLLAKIDALLHEVSHPFRNWKLIIPELRSYVLKNVNIYRDHEKGPEAFALFVGIFFDALVESAKNESLVNRILDALLAYVDKLALNLDAATLPRYEAGLTDFARRIRELDSSAPQLLLAIVQSQYTLRRMTTHIMQLWREETDPGHCRALKEMSQVMLQRNYAYWLAEEDPEPWFDKNCGVYCASWPGRPLLQAISHARIRACMARLEELESAEPERALGEMLKLPEHMDFVRSYRDIPAWMTIEQTGEKDTKALDKWRLLFLFRIMETEGLGLIHEETLREINRTLGQLIRRQTFEQIERFFTTTFRLLKTNVKRYPHTSLQCIQAIGNEVFQRNNSRLVEAFLWETVRFGFQYANVRGVDEDWQPIANPAHLTNIRVWLSLIQQEPKWCSTLFSALIINLHLSGTCVRDTDLFQRDITALLNHPIAPIYNLAKQFTKLMPVFFNDIGAEGELRNVSTELDEGHRRKDKLIHFLRKQAHVESNNLIVGFIEGIFLFWLDLDPGHVAPYVPQELLSQIDPHGPFVVEEHRLSLRIQKECAIWKLSQLLAWPDDRRDAYLARQTDIPEVERMRYARLHRMYKLVHVKYNLSLPEIHAQLEQAIQGGFPEIEQLLQLLEREKNPFVCLEALLDELEGLKAVILSPEHFEPTEQIYHKRHIAVDIPSVYGRYSERKFDALGLTFRLETVANVYLERLFDTVNLSFITQATFISILRCLKVFSRALNVDGIGSRRLDTYISMLESSIGIRRFSYTQQLDIMRGLSEGVKDIIYAYYTNIHQNNLSIIVPQIGMENMLAKYQKVWNNDARNMPENVLRISEIFFRDLIATTFGLQHLDNFIGNIISTLESQQDLLDHDTLDLLMTYNPKMAISLIHDPNPATNNLIHLGNKGYNLMVLAGEQKPVPPAFVITTEVFRCRSALQRFGRAREEFMRRMRRAITEVENRAGLVFGSTERPLLLSVRSGSAISMPGIMSTIHNVGFNEELVEEYVSLHPERRYFAWDNFRRFQQSWGMCEGMDREDFQEIMNAHKAQFHVRYKREFTAEAMHELALKYQDLVRTRGFAVPDDPWLQLVAAVELVLHSWDTPKAREYRHLMRVSDDWGTAVIVQAMAYGNLNAGAGSGVLFTAHPYRKVRRVALWGDYATGDQGEDIVSGLVTSYPISVEQAEIDGRDEDMTLERRFPEIYERLLTISRELVYDKEWNAQEIEFTFEGPKAEQLYLLQSRDMITIKKKEHLMVFADSDFAHRHIVAKGIGVSGSAMSGKAVFTEEHIRDLRRAAPDEKLILIRQDTVPEDIREISMADGLVTSRGGQTSHASVMATRLEKTCVVGCREMQVYETEGYAQIGDTRIAFGDPIAIDGRHGLLLEGNYPLNEEVHILPL